VAPGYRFFDDKTLPTFRAAAGRIIPSEPGSPGADSDGAIRVVDAAIAARSETDRRLLTAFLRAVEILPLVRYGRSFSSLSPERQDAVLEWLERNHWLAKFRQGFFGLKTFVLIGYYGLETTWSDIEYPGPRLDAPFYQLRVKDR
jgi:hypothetical protein